MIYPQKQFEMTTGTQQLKKQALELIISLYLNRTTNEEMKFLENNFGKVQELAEGIRTNLDNGLNEKKVLSNRIMYGENKYTQPKKSKRFDQILADQFFCPYFITAFILLLPGLIYGVTTGKIYYRYNTGLIYSLMALAAWTRFIISFVFSKKLKKSSEQKDKNSTYCVQRNGRLVEIEEKDIVVGDIIRLGFREEVPASGIIISDNSIFVKEGILQNGEEIIQNKSNLKECQNRLENLSNLELKMAFEQQNFPSPVILRGSQLVQGSTYWMMVLTVSEEQMLRQKGFQKKDIFISQSYDHWSNSLIEKWNYFSFFAIIFATMCLCLSKFVDPSIYQSSKTQNFELVLHVFTIVGSWAVVLDVKTLKTFLEVYFVKTIVALKVSKKIQDLISIQKIFCSEECVSKSDKIILENLGVCEKKDILYPNEVGKLDPVTCAVVNEILSIFELVEDEEDNELRKNSRIVHVNKKKQKIISSVIESNKGTGLLKNLFKQIVKINDQGILNPDLIAPKDIQPKASLKIIKSINENPKKYQLSILSVPKIRSGEEDLEEIIHSRCRVKSRGLMNDIAKIAQKGYRTYFFHEYSAEAMKQTKYVIVNGKIEALNGENLQRMTLMGMQLQNIFELSPVMIGYSEGSYKQKQMHILVAIIGITISQDNKVINLLKQFEKVGIKSAVTISKSLQENEKQEFRSQYLDRKWLKMLNNQIYNMEDIKKQLGRLVCGDCLIANCDCKNKSIAVSNVQPFLTITDHVRIIYNMSDEDYQYLESSCSQLKYGSLHLKPQNQSGLSSIEAVNQTLLFVEGLKRKTLLFYYIPFLFFIPQLAFYLKDIEAFEPRQMGMLALLYQIQLFLILYVGLEIPARQTNKFERSRIEIISRKSSLFLIVLTLLISIFSIVMFFKSSLIPEVRDEYDEIMSKYNLDPNLCKYAPNGGVTNTFDRTKCSLPETVQLKDQFQAFSRISQLLVIYTQLCLASVVILSSRNFRSWIVLIEYGLHIGTIVYMTYRLDPHFCLYRFGMSSTQWIIVSGLAVITLGLALGISRFLANSGLSDFFQDELQSMIMMNKQNEYHYSRVLKQYKIMKEERQLMVKNRENQRYSE